MRQFDFFYDVMIEKEDYCNREEEIEQLIKWTEAGRKMVIYAPRRYGKSSLIKNIIGHNFQSKRNHLTIYINLMEVQSLENIAERILYSFREVIKSKFPVKANFNTIIESFKGLSLALSLDPTTQLPSVEVNPLLESDKKNIGQIFTIIKNLSIKYKIFLIFDEFQDISLVPQAAGIMRSELQNLKAVPIAILGSKKHLLNQMFARNNSPFFNFGDEVILQAIAPQKWLSYFNKRLVPHTISIEALNYLCDVVNNVPNAICEVGAYLNESLKASKFKKHQITIMDVSQILEKKIDTKESIYRFQEGLLSSKEQSFLRVIAKRGFLLKPTEQSVVQESKISSGSIIKMVTRLSNKGWIEYEDGKGYRISDPLFSIFMKIKYN